MTACKLEVVASGDPMEMGIAQGAALRGKIRSSKKVLKQLSGFRMLQPTWMPYGIYLRIAEARAQRALEGVLKQDFPDLYSRMAGISKGSDVAMSSIYLFHALEPMMADLSRCSIVPAFGACSAVAVRGRRSSTGEAVIVRNFDYLPVVRPLYTLRRNHPKSGFRSVEFTIAPFAGAVDGVNEKGLCITYDYAYGNDFCGTASAPISASIAEALARCATVQEAADWIRSRPRWGAGILMLADAGGDIASLELSNTRTFLRQPSGDADLLFHTNAFFGDEMRSIEVNATARYTEQAPPVLRGRRIHESSEVRNTRFQQLLGGNAPLDLPELTRIMGDHESGGTPGDNSICKHSDYWNTTASLQFFPVSRRMRVAFDSTCRAQYAEFALGARACLPPAPDRILLKMSSIEERDVMQYRTAFRARIVFHTIESQKRRSR